MKVYIIKILNQGKIKENPIRCPQCGENKNFDLPENLNNKILICKSKICKNRIYCLSCKLRIEQEDIGGHLNCENRKNSECKINIFHYF